MSLNHKFRRKPYIRICLEHCFKARVVYSVTNHLAQLFSVHARFAYYTSGSGAASLNCTVVKYERGCAFGQTYSLGLIYRHVSDYSSGAFFRELIRLGGRLNRINIVPVEGSLYDSLYIAEVRTLLDLAALIKLFSCH